MGGRGAGQPGFHGEQLKERFWKAKKSIWLQRGGDGGGGKSRCEGSHPTVFCPENPNWPF